MYNNTNTYCDSFLGRKRKLNNNEGIVAPKTSKHNETGTSVQVQQQIASTSYAVVRTEHSTIHSQTYGDENKKIDNAKIDIGKEFLAWVQNVLGFFI